MRRHSWDWLASRLPVRTIWSLSNASPDPRPCLPAVEPLDDRVLLNAAAPAEQIKGESNVSVLIALLTSSNSLTLTQLSALGVAAKVAPDDDALLLKLAKDWLQVNSKIADFGEALIKGELTTQKHDVILAQL